MRLEAGDPALLIDSKGRQFLLDLSPDRTFQYHEGSVPHSHLIGQEDGSWIVSSTGAHLLLLRPRLADFVLKMKRGAQVVYPKDLGPILVYADIGPGMTVLEAGSGSGALTIGLSRAVGPEGRIVSVELREDHAAHARKAVGRWYGDVPANVELRVGDVAAEVEDVAPARIVLDLPEPWHVVEAAALSRPLHLERLLAVVAVSAAAFFFGHFAAPEEILGSVLVKTLVVLACAPLLLWIGRGQPIPR